MTRDGTQLIAGAESARQRLRDALAIERGSYPFNRDYGSLLGDLTDRNVDTALEGRVYAAVADAIAHPPNGLDDVALQEVRLYQDGDLVEVQVLAEWIDDARERTPIGIRQGLLPPQPNRPATGAPGITGVARVRVTLTATPGDVADPDGLPHIVTWSFQWLRAGQAIAGANASTYDPVDADEGMAISVRVSYLDGRGHLETRTSAATQPVLPPLDRVATGFPAIAGTARVGETLTATVGSLADPDGLPPIATWSFQWFRDLAVIAGATAMTYDLVDADEGAGIHVRVSFADELGTASIRTSPQTANVAPSGVPKARAGNNQHVAAGADVTLDGSASTDPDGTIATYLWEQTAGTTVALSDTGAVMPTFTAPSLANINVFAFRLTVTDDDGFSDTDTVLVIVQAAAPNQLPTARAGSDQNVAAGAEVTLDGSASTDPDGTIATYLWEQTAGTTVALSDTAAAMPTFTAPSTAAAQTLTFRLTVTDERGGNATDIIDVDVAAAPNQLPTARAGSDQNVAAGAEVTLDGSASTDPDGTIATYLWEQTAGTTVALSDTAAAMPTFTAPSTAAAQTLTFRLTVTDDRGGSTTDTIDVDVAALLSLADWAFSDSATNVLMLVEIDRDPAPELAQIDIYRHADAGTALGMFIAGDDVLGEEPTAQRITVIRYVDTHGVLVLRDVPDADAFVGTIEGTTVLIQTPTHSFATLGVSQAGGNFVQYALPEDGWQHLRGLANGSRMILGITPPNQLPTARAGADQSVAAGAVVTLDGSASTDPDGTIATYLWDQTAGTTVALSDTAAAMPTFTAPSTAAAQTLTFRLTVTDERGGNAADFIDVDVAAGLSLASWVLPDGRTERALMLLQAEVDGDNIYRHADAGTALGVLVDGVDTITVTIVTDSRVTRVRRIDAGQIRIHDNPDVDMLSVIFGSTLDAPRLHIQTTGGTSEWGYNNGGGNFANFTSDDADARALVAAIATGDEFILAITSAS